MQVYSATTTTVFVTCFEQDYIHRLNPRVSGAPRLSWECLHLVGPLASISKVGVLALLNTTGRSIFTSTGRECQDKKLIAVTSDWHAAVGVVD